MEIEYRNTSDDFAAYYELTQARHKKSGREDHHRFIVWYLVVLALGTYVSATHDEHFIACVFVTLALFFLWQNWSYARKWDAAVDAYARSAPAQACVLRADAGGLVESSSGVVLQIPWDSIAMYTVSRDHLIIHFLTERAFIVPWRHVGEKQRDEILALLVQHKVTKRAVQGL